MDDKLAFSKDQKKAITSLRKQTCLAPELWSTNLISPEKLARFSVDKGVRLFSGQTVKSLWNRGLIRADMIVTDKPYKRTGLHFVGTVSENRFIYLDNRILKRRAGGYGSTISLKSRLREDIKVLFHPFRYYVLYHIVRTFSSRVATTQFLLDEDGIKRLATVELKRLRDWTSTQTFCELIERWNSITELAVVLDPFSYTEIFRRIRWGHANTKKTISYKLSEYREQAKPAVLKIELQKLEAIRNELCCDAEIIDDNKIVHVLLRLCNATERERLKGALGGAMHVLVMAETIRRASESAYDKLLKEEDELGFGQWMDGARKRLYGSERIIDAPETVARQFLKTMGIDYGVRIRVYVEGETELGALTLFASGVGGIEFVNLRGQFLERGGKNLAFSGALQNDMDSNIFSLIVLDADNEDAVRVLRTTAKQQKMLGWFYISDPDFEYENFSTQELTNVALELANRDATPIDEALNVQSQEIYAKNGKEFIREFQNKFPQVPLVAKGKAWGEALMNFAIREYDGSESERQIIRIAKQIEWVVRVSYQDTLENYRVDPASGQLVKKDSTLND